MPKLNPSLVSVLTERKWSESRDSAQLEREAAAEALKERCRTELGIEISGQDLRRVAGYNEASTLYKWLKHGERDKRFRATIDLPTSKFVEEALRLRPKRAPRSRIIASARSARGP
jgi:hypothetical protein